MFPYIAVDVERAMRATWGWELRESRRPEWDPQPDRDDDDDEPERPGGLTVALRAVARLGRALRNVTSARTRQVPSG